MCAYSHFNYLITPVIEVATYLIINIMAEEVIEPFTRCSQAEFIQRNWRGEYTWVVSWSVTDMSNI